MLRARTDEEEEPEEPEEPEHRFHPSLSSSPAGVKRKQGNNPALVHLQAKDSLG